MGFSSSRDGGWQSLLDDLVLGDGRAGPGSKDRGVLASLEWCRVSLLILIVGGRGWMLVRDVYDTAW